MIRRVALATLLAFGLPAASVHADDQATQAPATQPAVTAAADDVVRVMPLGSSTVGGSTPGGFRVDLWQMLTEAGWSVDFVGSLSSPAHVGDPDHEGHGGYRIDQLAAGIVNWLNTYQPDVVLIHAGANDVLQNHQMATAPDRLGALIDTILQTKPGTKIYVSTVGPMNKTDVQARAEAFNNAIPGVVADRAERGQPVYFVDGRTVITPADVRNDPNGDFFHLTHSGNAKLATAWYGALTGTRVVRYEAENQAYGVVNNARRLQTPNASTYGKVGYIDHADSRLDLTVDAPYAGTFSVFVRAGNGIGQTCSHILTVNGGAQQTLSYESYGWEKWTMTKVDVQLQEGENTLRFGKGDCYAEIDSIDVTRPGPACASAPFADPS